MYSGCDRSTGIRRRLVRTSRGHGGGTSASRFALAGRRVAFVFETNTYADRFMAVRTADLRRGGSTRTLRRARHAEVDHALLLDAAGHCAFRTIAATNHQRLYAGSRLVDVGPRGSLTSLRIANGRLRWRAGGRARQRAFPR